MPIPYLKLALKNLVARKLRSLLTIVGIVIGITALVALLTIGQGLDHAITKQFEKIGSNKLFVYPEGAGDPTSRTGLEKKDVDVLENMPGFVYVTPYLMGKVPVTYANDQYSVTIMGFPDKDTEKRFVSHDMVLKQGRYFKEGERNVVMIGAAVAKTMFDKEVRLNNNFEIKGIKYRVIGIFDSFGNPEDDNSLFVPLDDARILLNKPMQVTMVELTVEEGIDLQKTVSEIKKNLRRKRGNDHFEVVTPDQILKQFGTVITIINVVLIGIAFISLIVGAVGIMNTMYTSVLERTREIGIMKAIGASNATIMVVFLFESGILGLVGGILGVTLGSLIALGIGAVAVQAGFGLLVITIEWPVVFGGILFSVIVGALSGILPSRQASQLKPIDALRH
ncbi:ABC transporter permease [Candidatus Woesearchaeota archaeon]|nr:ABC transporter permease [Candidatus Woesearchaeota archaeon]